MKKQDDSEEVMKVHDVNEIVHWLKEIKLQLFHLKDDPNGALSFSHQSDWPRNLSSPDRLMLS